MRRSPGSPERSARALPRRAGWRRRRCAPRSSRARPCAACPVGVTSGKAILYPILSGKTIQSREDYPLGRADASERLSALVWGAKALPGPASRAGAGGRLGPRRGLTLLVSQRLVRRMPSSSRTSCSAGRARNACPIASHSGAEKAERHTSGPGLATAATRCSQAQQSAATPTTSTR